MTHKLQIGDSVYQPHPADPNRWWRGTVQTTQDGQLCLIQELDPLPPENHKLVYHRRGLVVTREVPRCFQPKLVGEIPTATPPPTCLHLSTHQTKRERRRNRKRNR